MDGTYLDRTDDRAQYLNSGTQAWHRYSIRCVAHKLQELARGVKSAVDLLVLIVGRRKTFHGRSCLYLRWLLRCFCGRGSRERCEWRLEHHSTTPRKPHAATVHLQHVSYTSMDIVILPKAFGSMLICTSRCYALVRDPWTPWCETVN